MLAGRDYPRQHLGLTPSTVHGESRVVLALCILESPEAEGFTGLARCRQKVLMPCSLEGITLGRRLPCLAR